MIVAEVDEFERSDILLFVVLAPETRRLPILGWLLTEILVVGRFVRAVKLVLIGFTRLFL